ncbi:sulfatase-like hydrolase/transferase [Sphingobacterium sp. LRF_L2]|uniref:sulfatase-like hydrolase/transferase n=1 Tax=Sphingobacterium sp. LRF_L2 TaxID=3369421 RepID=UPI003F62BFC7
MRNKQGLLTQRKKLLLACMVAFCSQVNYAQVKQLPPNVIFIVADDLGYGDLGVYGNTIIKTPHIDQLAADGIRFTQAYAGASVCSPSRGTLLTGLHTGHARIRGNMTRKGGIKGQKGKIAVSRPNLLAQDSTIANVLRNNGYETYLVNKWHLDGFDTSAHPLNRGFQEFHGWLVKEDSSHNHYPTVRFRNNEAYTISENLHGKRGKHATDMATDEAIEIIQRKKDKPFFLLLTYNAPHTPLDVKKPHLYENTDLPENDKAYAALITQMDAGIGRVVKTVEELGIAHNTWIFFVSDNGGSREADVQLLKQNAPLRGAKTDLYEGGIRVPLIIRTADEQDAGKQSDFPNYFPDLFATLVDITKSHTSLPIDGISLLPELKSPNSLDPKQRFLYWEQYPNLGIAQAVRWDNWKLIRQNIDDAFELYNLEEDIGEVHNIADQKPLIVDKLTNFMQEAHIPSVLWPVKAD